MESILKEEKKRKLAINVLNSPHPRKINVKRSVRFKKDNRNTRKGTVYDKFSYKGIFNPNIRQNVKVELSREMMGSQSRQVLTRLDRVFTQFHDPKPP